MLRAMLLVITTCVMGCGTFASSFVTMQSPCYRGVQTDCNVIVGFMTDKNFLNANDSSPDTDPRGAVEKASLAAFLTLDLPFSFVADTLLLPVELYWYFKQEPKEPKAQDESPVEQAGGR
jgi:uncharacterized protein YceK